MGARGPGPDAPAGRGTAQSPSPGPARELLVGVGARRGASAREVLDLVRRTLAEAGAGTGAVRALATAAGRAGEPGLVAAAAELGVPLLAFDPARLAAVPVPAPSAVVRAAVGTPAVAEAAALLAAGPAGAQLLVGKRKSPPRDGGSAMVTCAVARRRATVGGPAPDRTDGPAPDRGPAPDGRAGPGPGRAPDEPPPAPRPGGGDHPARAAVAPRR